MMWMGKTSAWVALAMGAVFAANAYFQFATGVSSWVYAGTAALLLLGGYRTLRQMSGGLRLLAGAWGLAAGAQLLPLTSAPAPRDVPVHDTFYVVVSPLAIAFVLISFVGLALTVLHKEKKS
jgi:hypothetical protein